MVKLLLLFIVIPLVELALLIRLGTLIGVLDTILLIIFTGAAGAILVRAAGIQCLFTVRQQMQAGVFPADELCNGLLILIAGALLITPGLLTDVTGFSLLVPAIRNVIKTRLRAYIEKRINTVNMVTPDRK